LAVKACAGAPSNRSEQRSQLDCLYKTRRYVLRGGRKVIEVSSITLGLRALDRATWQKPGHSYPND